MTSQWRMKVSTSFRTLVMIPEMEVAGSGTMLVGSIRTPKSRQSLYIQMIMTDKNPESYYKDDISRTYYLIVSNKTSYFFIFSTQYLLPTKFDENIQPKHPTPKKDERSNLSQRKSSKFLISIHSGGAQLMCYLHTETLTATYLTQPCKRREGWASGLRSW